MISLTNHAIERYRDRICPTLNLAQAQERLTDALRTAQRLSGRTKYGQLRYALPGCHLIVKETRDSGLLAVTCYPKNATPNQWQAILNDLAREAEEAALRPVHRPAVVVAQVPEPTQAIRGHAVSEAADQVVRADDLLAQLYEMGTSVPVLKAQLAKAQRKTERIRAHAANREARANEYRDKLIAAGLWTCEDDA